MGLKECIRPFAWSFYPRKLSDYICRFRSAGSFTQEDARASGLRFLQGEAGSTKEGNFIRFYGLIDPEDGVIIDMKYRLYGEAVLIGLAEAACHLSVGKTYEAIAKITPKTMVLFLGEPEDSFFSSEGHILLVIEALRNGVADCFDIPLPEKSSPPDSPSIEGEGYAGYENLSLQEKIALINRVLDEEIRPYVEMDAGGVEVADLQGNRLFINYQGSCTSCHSAVGSTLSSIRQILRARVSPDMEVIPNL